MKSPSGGFTLPEILVAMTVISVLGAATFYAVNSQTRTGVRNTQMIRGIAVAKQKMDSLKITDYDSLASGSDTVSGVDTVENQFLRSWRITTFRDDHGSPKGRKKISLTVHWPLTAEHQVTFTTLVSDKNFRDKR